MLSWNPWLFKTFQCKLQILAGLNIEREREISYIYIFVEYGKIKLWDFYFYVSAKWAVNHLVT